MSEPDALLSLTLPSFTLPSFTVLSFPATAFPGRVGAAVLLGGGAGLGLYFVVLGLVARDSGPVTRPGVRARGLARRWSRREVARVAVTALASVAAVALTGWIVGAVLVGAACWFLPRILGRDVAHARRVARIEAIATWTEMIRDTLAAASGLEQALLATAPLAPAPIRDEVRALAARLDSGQRLVPALRMLARDLADPTADLVVAALTIAAEQQARQLTDLLGALAATARERASMRMRVEAGRARSRTSVRVIVGTTTAFAALVVLLNRPYLSVFDSPVGQAVLLGIGLLFAAGFAWLQRIAAVPEAGRLYVDGDTDDADTNTGDTDAHDGNGGEAGNGARSSDWSASDGRASDWRAVARRQP